MVRTKRNVKQVWASVQKIQKYTHPAFKKVNGTATLENNWTDFQMMKPGVSTQPSNSIHRYILKKSKAMQLYKNDYMYEQKCPQ